MFPESAKFWTASDATFNRVANKPELRPVWREWVRRGRQPERARKSYRFVNTRLSVLPSAPDLARSIRLDPSFRGAVVDLANRPIPAVVKELDRYSASIAFNAWRKWPIDSGFSRALLSLEYSQPEPGVIVSSVHSNAWYSFYVRSFQKGLGGRYAYRALLFDFARSKLSGTALNIAKSAARR